MKNFAMVRKLFFRHVSYSLSYGKYKLFIFYSIAAFLALATSIQIKTIGSNSIGAFFLLLKDNGYLYRLSDYQVPFSWDFIQFFTLFLIGDFLFHDLDSNRRYLLLRCRSKMNYILSKIIWVAVQNMFIYIGLFAVIYVISSLVLGNFSMGDSPFFNNTISSMMEIKEAPGQLLLRIFIGFEVTSLVLSSLQLLFLQFASPIVTFLSVIILSSLSTFSDSKWLPAIHSMILRQNIFDLKHHLTLGFSVAYCAIVYILVTLFTIFLFQKKDIL